MSQVFVNNGVSTLAANVAAADTSIFIQAGHVARFPTIAAPDYCFVTLENAAGALEIVKVTAHAAASASLTVVRGQQGTTALDWLTGDLVELRLTKDELNRFERAALRDGDTYSNTHDFLSATLKVKTPTNPFEAASKAYADSLIAAAAAAGAAGQLPNQAGKAGAFLKTNGTVATFEFIPGSDGAKVTGNISLTSTSPSAMTVTPTGFGLCATLPDATTCVKGVSLFSFYNSGDYDYGLKDSAGTLLGWIKPKTGAVIGLSDNLTSAGVWALYGVEKLGITAAFSNPSISNTSGVCQRIALDANRSCFIFGGTNVYGVVYDGSTQTWGSPTLIRSGIASGAFVSCLSATNQVLVVSSDTSTALQAVVLTIATNTITVNTAGAVVLAGNFSAIGQVIAVGASFVCSYSRDTTTSGIRAISISGTTVTIGTESVLDTTSTNVANLYASASIVRTIMLTFSSSVQCKPFTVSGTTLSAGTAATTGANSGASQFRSFLNGNGNIVAEYINGTHTAAIFKLTGTTEASSAVSLGNVPTSIIQYADYIAISPSKTLFTAVTAGVNWYANILTDTAGTASAGTQITGTASGSLNQGLVPFYSSSNVVRAALSAGTNYVQVTFDCSGSSPVLSSQQARSSVSNQFESISASNQYGQKRANWVLNGASMIHLANLSVAGGTQIGLSLRYISTGFDSVKTPIVSPLFSNTDLGIGASNTETYLSSPISNTTGFAIAKVEMAA